MFIFVVTTYWWQSDTYFPFTEVILSLKFLLNHKWFKEILNDRWYWDIAKIVVLQWEWLTFEKYSKLFWWVILVVHAFSRGLGIYPLVSWILEGDISLVFWGFFYCSITLEGRRSGQVYGSVTLNFHLAVFLVSLLLFESLILLELILVCRV